MKLRRFMLGLSALLLLGSLAQADTLRMKNGTVIRGRVVRFTNGEFTILIEGSSGGSRAIVSVGDIDSIEFDSASAPAPTGSATRPGPAGGQTQSSTPAGSNPTSATDQRSGPGPAATDRPATQPPAGNPGTPAPGTVPNIRSASVNVPARDDWTSTGIVVTRGQRVRITATGQVDLGAGRKSGPEGIVLDDKERLMLNWLAGGLIAVIGDDNDEFIFIGRASEFVAQRSGRLFLSVNEGNLKDNQGSYTARVEVELAQPAPVR